MGRRRKKTKQTIAPVQIDTMAELENTNKWFEPAVMIILLAFSAYKAIKLFGALPVPNPDFDGFLNTGRAMLNFRLPPSFKRAPVVGVMIVGLGRCLGGLHPMLTAGWLLNAVLSCFNTILLWQIAKKLIGKAAIWFAVIVTLNPWVMRYQIDPIAETTMIFFILATFYFIFRHSNWAYLFASIGTMVRYECAVLIFIVFVIDVVTRKTKKERVQAFCWAALASLPFLLWMLGTYLHWNPAASHYIKHYRQGPKTTGFPRYLFLLWSSVYSSMFQLPSYIKASVEGVTSKAHAEAITDAIKSLHLYSKIFAVAGCSVAVLYGIIKKNWYLISLLIFMFFYIIAHSTRVNSHPRYCVPIVWMVLLVSWYGFYVLWKLIDRPQKSFKVITYIILAAAGIVSAGCLIRIYPYLARVAGKSIKVSTIPYAAMITVALILIVYLIAFRGKSAVKFVVLSLATCFIVASLHFSSVGLIGNGEYNIEFKMLADWYDQNAADGEKLASTWTHVLRRIASKYEADFVPLTACGGETFDEIVEKCYEKDLTYVTWTHRGSRSTRVGLSPLTKYLKKPQSHYPFQFLYRIQLSEKSWINIFRLVPKRPETPNEKKLNE